MTKIKSITMKNFKLFGAEPYTINFSDAQLILMDGPNGYGKTSIFDAIELALTGNITRLITLENRQTPADIVVACNNAKDVEITIELAENTSTTIIRKLRNPLPRDAKKISKFQELWDIFVKTGDELRSITQSALNTYLKNENFTRDFHLFHYIQQEETARFLKSKNETQRAEELSKLFGDTKGAEEKLSKLLVIQKKVDSMKLESFREISTIKQAHDITNTAELASQTKIDHEYLLPWLVTISKSPDWDSPLSETLSQEKLNTALDSLSQISSFLLYKDLYLKERKYARSAQEKDIIKLYIKFYNALDKQEEYVNLYLKIKNLTKCLDLIITNELIQLSQFTGLQQVFQSIGSTELLTFLEILTELIAEEQKSVGINRLYIALIKERDALSQHLSQLENENNCPLCGQHYDNHNDLMDKASIHGQLLRTLLGDQEQKIVKLREDFFTKKLIPLQEQITNFLNTHRSPSDQEISELSNAISLRERITGLHSWLINEKIEHTDLLETTLPIPSDEFEIEDRTNTLANRIRSAANITDEKYHEANLGNIFDLVYREYFNNNSSLIGQIPEESLTNKIKYLRLQFFKSIHSIILKLNSLEEKHEKLRTLKDELSEIIQSVRTQIRQYRKRLITDIEIPFYIYSGKILQTHQAGLGQGILIKDPTGGEELKNVRLVSNWDSDHDIMNTMSSGQISAIVIALTLALNKVYAKDFSPILIDDPVQTMDEINMSSLVELLRNEFSHKQIILSTHEDKVSKYFIYKFLKHQKTVKNINVMERKEYTPVNQFIYETPAPIPDIPLDSIDPI
ncbi:DNA repair exonuclease SbcCD ATPase subunit [Pseudomonas frederiksbergensis]|uniref:AAA family ATPase n=1 Tax=Pseudomonas frederiksbergensis TaxID=104087 RepID=UPI003D1BE804